MRRHSANVWLVAAILLLLVASAPAATRAVLCELHGATWCGYCPNSTEAMGQLEDEYGTDRVVMIYNHVNDSFATAETQLRASKFYVGSVPHMVFDAFHEVIGAASPEAAYNAYKPLIEDRLATPTPVTIEARGVIEDTTGWVQATFRAVDTVGYGTLDAEFVILEDPTLYPPETGSPYPWTVRDYLPPESVNLSAPGDSAVFMKNFDLDPSWDRDKIKVVVFLETHSGDLEVVNAQNMMSPYDFSIAATEFAKEINYYGQSSFETFITNTGMVPDTLTVDLETEYPAGVTWEYLGSYCDTLGNCYYEPFAAHDFPLDAGETMKITVYMADNAGSIPGLGLVTLLGTSKGDPGVGFSETFATFVEYPSVLLVDDDGGAAHETELETALTDNGLVPHVWDASVDGRPSADRLSSYWSVFWTTAAGDCAYLGEDDALALTGYLDNGGQLFMASANYLSSRAVTNTFITDYLHLSSWEDDVSGFVASGVEDDPIGDGMSLGLMSGTLTPYESDRMILAAGADSSFTSANGVKGITVNEADHAVVFLSFPFESVSVGAADPNNQRTIIERILGWFTPTTGVDDGVVEVSRRLSLGPCVPNPFNPSAKLRFVIPEGTRTVRLTIHDVSGRLVRTLESGSMAPGPHARAWDGRDDGGCAVASGIYFARLATDAGVATTKMTLLK